MQLVDLIWNDQLLRQYYISSALIAIPVTRILMRAGFKPFWALLLLIPDIGFILCTVLLALRKWPQAKGT